MNHKNFHFAQIPDKTNDVIFLKSLKPCFWAIFDHFFQKNPAPSHITRYGPLTPCQVSEKTNEPILRKFTDRQKDGRMEEWTDRRTDRWTLFYRTLPAKAGGPKIKKQSYINRAAHRAKQ